MTELRKKARQAMDYGRLPKGRPSRTWGGRGSDARCAVCDLPIFPDQLELEMEFADQGTFHLHVSCSYAWFAERAGTDRTEPYEQRSPAVRRAVRVQQRQRPEEPGSRT